MKSKNSATLSILGKDSTILPYRRELAMITGSINSAILLNQILYWYEKMDRQPFFKYKEPPTQKENETDEQYYERVYPYKEGDSWTEELYFTREEFDEALYLIAHNKNNPKMYRDGNRRTKKEEQAIKEGKILYPIKNYIRFWTTRERLTYYEINDIDGLSNVLDIVFLNEDLHFRKTNNNTLDIVQRILTETTTVCSKEHSNSSRVAGTAEEFNTQQDSENDNPVGIQPSADSNSKAKILRAAFKGAKKKKTPKPEAAPCPKKYEPFLESWEFHTQRIFQGRNGVYTKSWKAIQKAVNGKFFGPKDTPTADKRHYGTKLTLEKWNFALERFAVMRNNADYYPKDKKTINAITPDTFLYSAFSPNKKNKSYFITCIENEPVPLAPQIKDANPEYTDTVIEMCKKEFGWDLSNGKRSIAIRCASRLSKFFIENKSRIQLCDYHYKYPYQQIQELLTMLDKNAYADHPPDPIYLCTDLTYQKLFPKHLKNVGSMD